MHREDRRAGEDHARPGRRRDDDGSVPDHAGRRPDCPVAIDAFAPPMQEFRRGRDFATWLGLVPRQQSTGGEQVLGRTSKMGQRDIRRLLIIGAMAVVRAAVRRGVAEEGWLGRMLTRKPRLVVVIALVSKKVRAARAMQTKEETCRGPLAAQEASAARRDAGRD